MAAHIPKQVRSKNDPQALEQQAIADDEEASLLANQQAQVSLIYSHNVELCLDYIPQHNPINRS